MIRLTEKQKSYINNLQNNLGLIIAIMGMSKEEFGSKMDLTRQSIFNLVSKKIKMNKTQYIAIRRIIDFYIENDNSPIDLNRLSLSQIIPFKLNTNIRADIDVMKQRLCMNAQWEIRQFMEDRKSQLGSTTFAPIYKAFAKPNCQTIGCQEGNYAHPECQKSGRCNNKKVDSE